MLKIFITALLFFFFPVVHADIYQWTDTHGVIHYSDTPQNGAVRVQLAPDSSIARSTTPVSVKPAITTKIASQTQSYTKLVIIQPTGQQTFNNAAQGNVIVMVDIQPALQAKDKLQLLFDGKLIQTKQSTNFKLSNIDRGAHTLQVRVISAEGAVLMTSTAVNFNVQRTFLRRQH